MGRKAGSKNRPKEEIQAEKEAKAARKASGGSRATKAPAAKSAGVGHNSELTEGEKQNRLIMGLAEIERLQKEQLSIGSQISNERKRLASFGFKRKQVEFGLSLRKAKDQESIDEWRQLMRIARFLNHPIGTQPGLFDLPEEEVSPVDQAKAAGRQAALEGLECKPPYATSSDEGQGWIEGWHGGHAERLTLLADATDGAASGKVVSGAAPRADDAFDDAVDNAPKEGEEGPESEEAKAGRRRYIDDLKAQNNEVDRERRAMATGAAPEADRQPAAAA